jgi:hypothetical protein
MANTKSEINPSYSKADQTHCLTHRNLKLKEKSVACPADGKASKNEMLENILKKYRSAWKKLAKL